MTRMYEFFYEHAPVEFSRPPKLLNEIETDALKTVAEAYAANFENLKELGSLPLALLRVGHMAADEYELHLRAVVKTNLSVSDPQFRDRLHEEFIKLRNQTRDDEDWSQARMDAAVEALKSFLPRTASSARVLVYAVVSGAWTAFECAAKDAWVQAVNLSPMRLAQGAFKTLPTDAEADLSRRSVSVGLLAKHGFDVRHKLGLILSGRFDFTGVLGIRTAYVSAFGDDAQLVDVVRNDDLAFLEAVRHLIAHRAGVVDDEFLRRAGARSRQVAGEQLELDVAAVTQCINAALIGGDQLLRYVDEWLAANQDPNQTTT